MAKKSEFEVRLETIKHIANIILEMSYVDFETLTPQEEQEMLEDLEEIAGHVLDSMSFKPSPSEDGVSFSADFSIIDAKKYAKEFFSNNP